MTIQEVMTKALEIFTEGEVVVSIEQTIRVRGVWPYGGGKVTTLRWIHHRSLPSGCISSDRSWEHALAIAASGNEEIWDEVDDPIEEETNHNHFARDEWRHEAEKAQRLK